MAKQLLIMRHAKSSWSDVNATDHERTLNKRGLRDAPRMAKFVANKGCQPNWVASSTAMRAKTTAELFVEHCDGVEEDQLELIDRFYHATPRVYLQYLSEIFQDNIETVMVIGHNPGLEELVHRLSGEYERMPTATIAWFRLDIEKWSDIDGTPAAELLDIWRPKEIDD